MKKFRALLENIVQDWKEGDFIVSFRVRTLPTGLDELMEEDLSVSVTKWREKRSLTANAYYWVLVGKISDVTGRSNAEVHNMLLRRYGVPEIVNGEMIAVMVPNTEEAEKEVLQKEIYHLKPTSMIRGDRRGYVLLKGSSDFDSKEMSRLITGTVEEAEEIGIETLPPEELRRMLEAYEINNSDRH